jgi:hypothetical protein
MYIDLTCHLVLTVPETNNNNNKFPVLSHWVTKTGMEEGLAAGTFQCRDT